MNHATMAQLIKETEADEDSNFKKKCQRITRQWQFQMFLVWLQPKKPELGTNKGTSATAAAKMKKNVKRKQPKKTCQNGKGRQHHYE